MFGPLLSAFLLLSELAYDPEVRSAMWRLLEDTRYGFAETEEAMFIVREGDGRLSFIRWTSLGIPHQARWVGAVPKGAVAIAHTHPNWRWRPSHVDERTARSSGLSVYVVTRDRIVRTNGGQATTVVRGEWQPARAN